MNFKFKNHQKFADVMEEAGWDVEEYHGRFFYVGPAVRTDENDPEHDLQSALAASPVKAQWDNMGFDYIVYPK